MKWTEEAFKNVMFWMCIANLAMMVVGGINPFNLFGAIWCASFHTYYVWRRNK